MSVERIFILVSISAPTLMAAFHVAVMKDTGWMLMDRIAVVQYVHYYILKDCVDYICLLKKNHLIVLLNMQFSHDWLQ